MDKPALELKFDPNTIEHLGVSLYSQLPSVLSELISNAWDADAKSVLIDSRVINRYTSALLEKWQLTPQSAQSETEF